MQVAAAKGPVTIAGTMPTVHVGETLRLDGAWTLHPQYGRQFQVARYQALIPGTIPGLKKYLGSGLLKGVGPVWAEHMVNAFGFDTLQVLEREPRAPAQHSRPGRARARQAIAAAWREQAALKDLMEFLQAAGPARAAGPAHRQTLRRRGRARRARATLPPDRRGVRRHLRPRRRHRPRAAACRPTARQRIAAVASSTCWARPARGAYLGRAGDLLDAAARLLGLPVGADRRACCPGMVRDGADRD